MEQSQHKVKSADRVLDILELFDGEQESYNLTEIAKNLNMPPSSAYLILKNMLARGYLETDKSGKQFRLGFRLFMIRDRYVQGASLSGEFFKIADRIIEEVNETVALATRSGSNLMYIGQKSSTHALRYTPSNTILPLHAAASGKVLLADLSMEELREIYPQDNLEKITDKTIASFPALAAELQRVREQGYAYNYGESVEGVHCVAYPIVDADNKASAAISISIPVVRISGGKLDNVHSCLKQASEELSRRVFQRN